MTAKIKLTDPYRDDTDAGRFSLAYRLIGYPPQATIPVTVEYTTGARVQDNAHTDEAGDSGDVELTGPAWAAPASITAGDTTVKVPTGKHRRATTPGKVTVTCDDTPSAHGHPFYDVTVTATGLTPGSEATLAITMDDGTTTGGPLPVDPDGRATYRRETLHRSHGGQVQVTDTETGATSSPVRLLTGTKAGE